MTDVSATGSSIQITTDVTGLINITRFSDEGTPFEFNEIEVTGSALSLNGELITWAKPVAYAASVTVVPMTSEDEALRKLLIASKVKYSKGNTVAVNTDAVTVTMNASIPKLNNNGSAYRGFMFTNGRIVSGPSAPSSSAEGKLSARTYTFVFEGMKV